MKGDPRLSVIDRRLEKVGRIIAVTGGKGGIGKSMVSSCLALNLARSGQKVGLLDLDLTGPCDHLILGIDSPFPEEEFGLVPPLASGIRFMSITYFTGERPAPLRGTDVSNALIELLAIVQWGELDFLVIDMPPGLGDALLDALRLLRRAEFLVVSTASRVVLETVKRSLDLLGQVGVPIVGVLENMRRREGKGVEELALQNGLLFLGSLPFDEELEEALGDAEQLTQTAAASALMRVVRNALLT
ncbi:MAG: ATP-binding protein [Gemmatimonadetes bacterium]|jgi:ATP-binding protein involved in chromosome partitioning|nr:ATP-binding protein [Gemmatimonadota bacterium]